MARDAAQSIDLPVVQGMVLCGALLVCVASLVADAALAWLDPRIRR